MLRPLSEDEKRTALKQMVEATREEAKRRAPELKQIQETAQALFWSLVKTPTLHVTQADMPSDMTHAPVEEIWSVQPRVTVE